MEKTLRVSLSVLVSVLAFGASAPLAFAFANPATVDLGGASNFAVLSKAAINNTPTSTITGDIGISPLSGTAITGFACPNPVIGTVHVASAGGPTSLCQTVDPDVLTPIILSMQNAYIDAFGRTPGDMVTINTALDGLTLTPGVYSAANFDLSTDANVTLDCGGDSSGVFIFHTAGHLTLGSNAHVNIGSCQTGNIFWAVAGTTNIGGGVGTHSTLQGTVLGGPGTSEISVVTGSTILGRLLGQKTITLDSNIITVPTAVSSTKDITAFNFSVGTSTISGTNIAVTVPFGTNVTALTPTTLAITGTSVSPLIGVAQDFTNPVTYTVTDAGGLTKTYTVTVTVAQIILVYNLDPSWTAIGGGGVYSAYIGPPDYGYVSPGTTALYDGREAGIIKAGITASSTGTYDDEGLFGFKPGETPIATFAAQPLTYTFENQYGTAPVWVYIELNKGTTGDIMYQYVPTLNPAGWHTEDAATGAHWQAWTAPGSGITTGSMVSLANIAAANPGKTVSRVYLTEGMGDSYHSTPNGTVAWVDKATIGDTTYDFVVSPIFGCRDSAANNYNPSATSQEGVTCTYPAPAPVVNGAILSFSGGGGGTPNPLPGQEGATPATPAVPGVSPATPATPAQGRVLGAAVYNFGQNLSVGSRGADVTALQQFLIDNGFSIPAGATGYFGAQTKVAAIAFQKARGIAQTGFVGSLSRAELNKGAVATTVETSGSKLDAGQASAVIGFLQAFGADANIIANVKKALGI